MLLNIHQLRVDGGTQPRGHTNVDVVSQYAEDIANDAEFPPVVAFFDGTEYWLADGFHRHLAHEALGLAEIDVDVRQGAQRDAILYSVGANSDHGYQRSNEDKRRAVRKLLEDTEWSSWSDREIARQCRVSKTFVNNLRPNHTGNIASMARTFTHHKTGKPSVMRTENIGRTYEPRPVDFTPDIAPRNFHSKDISLSKDASRIAVCMKVLSEAIRISPEQFAATDNTPIDEARRHCNHIEEWISKLRKVMENENITA